MKKDNLSNRFADQMPKIEDQIKASKWYGKNEEGIRKKFGGKFIAIKGTEIESSNSAEKLIKKLHDSSEWFIVYVPKEKMIACW